MNAIGTSSSAPAPVAPVTATAPAQAPAGEDFVGMLMQLVAGSVVTPAAPLATKLPSAAGAVEDSDDTEALAAMLAMQPAVPPAILPWAAQPAAATDTGSDPLQMLGLGGGARGSDELLAGLTAQLAEALPEPLMPEMDGDAANGVGSLSPFNETPQVRASNAEVAAARTLHSPVGTERWAEELGNRMTMMVDRHQQTASLRLSPEHLGPLEVRISITDDKASVWFGATHADTRAAIENALPRLREMFTAQGLSLADAGVFREPPRDQQPAVRTLPGAAPDTAAEGEVHISTRTIGLLDAYA